MTKGNIVPPSPELKEISSRESRQPHAGAPVPAYITPDARPRLVWNHSKSRVAAGR